MALLKFSTTGLEGHSKHVIMSDRAWKLSGGWCYRSSGPKIDMVQGFIVYSRIDNILGCRAPANPTRTTYTEEMICTADSRRVASGPIFCDAEQFSVTRIFLLAATVCRNEPSPNITKALFHSNSRRSFDGLLVHKMWGNLKHLKKMVAL